MKIKKIVAILVDENGVESEAPLCALSPYATSFNYTKVAQIVNPMMQQNGAGSSMFGYKFEIGLPYALDEEQEDE